MKSNFEFLNQYWEDLSEIGKLAEGYLSITINWQIIEQYLCCRKNKKTC